MAEVTKPIKVGNVWTNLISGTTGESVNFEEVAEWHDGTPMDDSKCDGVIYRKLPASVGGGYVKRIFTDGIINVKWFGAKGDDSTDDTAIIQQAADLAYALRRGSTLSSNIKLLFPINHVFVATDTISIKEGIDVDMAGRVVYRGVKDRPVFVIGSVGVANRGVNININVNTVRDSGWSSSNFEGVRLVNTNQGSINIELADGFYKGVTCIGIDQGFAYNKVTIQSLNANKYGLYLDYSGTGWCNENNFYGGRFSTITGNNPGQTRVGVRITGDNNRFFHPSFELHYPTSAPGFSHAAIFDDAIDCKIHYCRNEGNSSANIDGGYAFIANGRTRNCIIEVGYTWDRQRARERNAFQDNSETKQNKYISLDNLYADGHFGNKVFDSGYLVEKIVNTNASRAIIPGVTFIWRDGTINAASPDTGVTTRVVGNNRVELQSTGIGTYLNTTLSKKLLVVKDSQNGRAGLVGIKCYDTNRVEITNPDIDVCIDKQSGDSIPNQELIYSTEYGGCYLTQGPAPIDTPTYFSVKDNVARIFVFVGMPTSYTTIASFQVYSLDSTIKPTSATTGRLTSDGLKRVWGNTPPEYGTYTTGEIIFSRLPQTGYPLYWVCKEYGTQHTISISGDYTSGNTITNISDMSAVQVGDYLTIQGFTGTQYYVTSKNTTDNSITLNTSSGAVAGTSLLIQNKPADWGVGHTLDTQRAGFVSPEGNYRSGVGGVYHNMNPSTAGNHPLYVKVTGTGTTGWKYLLTEDDRVAAASPNTATSVGATYNQAEVQAILTELRDLKTKMRAAGLLET